MARGEWAHSEPTRAGDRDKGLGESTLDLEAGSNAPAGVASSRGVDWGCEHVGPRRVPSTSGEPARGPSLGPGPPEPEPQAGRAGQAGRRTCLPGSPVRTGLPAPLPPLPRSPLGLAAGFRMVQTKRRSRNRVRSPSLRQAARPDATVLVRNVGQRLPPARPDPTPGSASGRRHRGPLPEGDEGPRREPVYLRDQREQRLLHRTSFDLQSRVEGEARRAGAANAGRAQRGGHGPRPVAQPGRRPPASTPAAAAKQPRRPRPRPQPSRATPPGRPRPHALGSRVCPAAPLGLSHFSAPTRPRLDGSNQTPAGFEGLCGLLPGQRQRSLAKLFVLLVGDSS